MGQNYDSNMRARSESPTSIRIPDLFVNQRKLQDRLNSIYGRPIQCYWRQGAWCIDDAPKALSEVFSNLVGSRFRIDCKYRENEQACNYDARPATLSP